MHRTPMSLWRCSSRIETISMWRKPPNDAGLSSPGSSPSRSPKRTVPSSLQKVIPISCLVGFKVESLGFRV